ncbi:hypothetical protein [Mesorhizobium sp. SP-1A]|uniref:hypothetical protein n=1 Tax=Mesorhizobium sp. SP-1A TaxID=3077840 RepID=UPI0028F71CBD|nr:hypothetical protein [Mesorhizobium sp. SP-1A]
MTVSYTISPAIPSKLMEQTVPGQLLLQFMRKEVVDGVTMSRLYRMGPDFDKLQNYYYLSLQKDHQYHGQMDIPHSLAREMIVFTDGMAEDHPLYDLRLVAEASLAEPEGLQRVDDYQFEEKLEDLLQALCQAAPDKLPVVTVEGSRTGDKLTIGEHGGFASVITADGYETMTTQLFIHETTARLKAKKSVEAEAPKAGM